MATALSSFLNGSYQGYDVARTVLNDVSTHVNGIRGVFTLRLDQTDLGLTTIADSKDLDVIVNGYQLTPYVTEIGFPWINVCYSFSGFRVRENRVIIYSAPPLRSKINITINRSSTSKQTRRYPFSATTIGLGD